MIAIVEIRYRCYTVIPFIGVVFSFLGSLSFLFLDEFEGNANMSVAIKSSSTRRYVSDMWDTAPRSNCSKTWLL